MTTILEFMSEDHDRLDNKIKMYSTEKLVNVERAEGIFILFKSELERHIIWEEDILFPVFERKTWHQRWWSDFSYENGTYPDQKSSSGNKKKTSCEEYTRSL